MNANEFVKKFGWDKVKSIVLDFNYNSSNKFIVNLTDNSAISIYDLKRLIKSHELVESYGGIDAANKTICDAFHGSNYPIPEGHEKLSLAIQDVESCQ